MTKLAFFTISDPDYVDLAPTMFDSVKEHYPEADLYLFMIGNGTERTFANGVSVIYLDEVLDSRDLEQRLCYYLSVEMATSVRPDCFKALLSKGYDQVIYFDPDIYLFRRMTEVDCLLADGMNGVVTPHALKSVPAGNGALPDGDRVLMQVGIFNMGFLALRRSEETFRMLDWWQAKLKWLCVCDLKNGYFVDQKWMEFLPVYFENFHILRSGAYNLAPWNAEHYNIIQDGDVFYVDSKNHPVAFIHFSGIKRSHAHYKDMPGALKFYLNKIQRWENKGYGFRPYVLRTSRESIPWDKVCTLLNKEWVGATQDRDSLPLSTDDFYIFLTGNDPEVGFPNYIRKLFEIFPRYASSVFGLAGANYASVLVESKAEITPYKGCIYPETVLALKAIFEKNSNQDLSRLTESTTKVKVRRRMRKILGRRLYWLFDSNSNPALLTIALRQARDADIVK
jgi:hypothetical protein